MIALSTATRVFVAPGATDMRKSFNGLFALVRHQLEADPLIADLAASLYHLRGSLVDDNGLAARTAAVLAG